MMTLYSLNSGVFEMAACYLLVGLLIMLLLRFFVLKFTVKIGWWLVAMIVWPFLAFVGAFALITALFDVEL